MDKPSWIDEVKEIAFEEAELMYSLGVDVGCDWGPESYWSFSPVYLSDGNGDEWWWAVLRWKGRGRPVVFYVRKDEEQI